MTDGQGSVAVISPFVSGAGNKTALGILLRRSRSSFSHALKTGLGVISVFGVLKLQFYTLPFSTYSLWELGQAA